MRSNGNEMTKHGRSAYFVLFFKNVVRRDDYSLPETTTVGGTHVVRHVLVHV